MPQNLRSQQGHCGLYTLEETAEMIRAGRLLIVAADGDVLTSLPVGTWLGGVCTRFQVGNGCVRSEEKAYVIDLTDVVQSYRLGLYPDFAMESVYEDMSSNGFSFLLIPGFSEVHRYFGAQFAIRRKPTSSPLTGFVAGADVGEAYMQDPFVVDGMHGVVYRDSGVALHCRIRKSQRARIEVINPFSEGAAGDVITFESSALVLRECKVNGETRNFADYVREHAIPEGLPLVGRVRGMTLNVTLLFPLGRRSVTALSPVLPSVEYRFARRDEMGCQRYVDVARRATRRVVASMHGYGNYPMMAKEGNKERPFPGPFAFGEIAMLLMNQTTVNLIVEEVDDDEVQ